MLKRFSYFILILLVEGAALMAVELMGAKLVAPFYGSSLYVWTAVLGFTVAGLTLGYYCGGRLATRTLSEKTLFIILGISAALVFALPYTASALISFTSSFDLVPGICTMCLLLLVPPMLCFGMVGACGRKTIVSQAPQPGKHCWCSLLHVHYGWHTGYFFIRLLPGAGGRPPVLCYSDRRGAGSTIAAMVCPRLPARRYYGHTKSGCLTCG